VTPRCACRCVCAQDREAGCNDLCARCWREWCTAEKDYAKHAPIADRSYLGTFGMTGCWTSWILNRASELLARPLSEWTQAEVAPKCPAERPYLVCGEPMVRRPGKWACYHHQPPVVINDVPEAPTTPRLKVIA